MLAKRIIPSITHKNGQLVKGERFINNRVIGVALQSARIYAMRSVDELLILDVSATEEKREPNYFLIKSLANSCFSPITVGGGITCDEHVRKLLQAGADKVCIGRAAIDNPILIHDLASKYGSSAIAASVECMGTDDKSHAQALVDALLFQEMGAGEILLHSVVRDGTMGGYDIRLIESVSRLRIPVIASGGCAGYTDMVDAIDVGADAVSAGALFAFTDDTPEGAARYLKTMGIEVRV